METLSSVSLTWRDRVVVYFGHAIDFRVGRPEIRTRRGCDENANGNVSSPFDSHWMLYERRKLTLFVPQEPCAS